MHDCHVQMLTYRSANVFVCNFQMLYAVLDLVKVMDSQNLNFASVPLGQEARLSKLNLL